MSEWVVCLAWLAANRFVRPDTEREMVTDDHQSVLWCQAATSIDKWDTSNWTGRSVPRSMTKIAQVTDTHRGRQRDSD